MVVVGDEMPEAFAGVVEKLHAAVGDTMWARFLVELLGHWPSDATEYVRSTTPYANGKLLNAAFWSTGAPGTPLKVPGASGVIAPLFGARSPTTGLETS